MFILRDLLQPLQACFPDNNSGKERGIWSVYTLLCVTIHFTSARTSNLLRAMEMLGEIAKALPGRSFLIVTDSWFGNDGLFKPMRLALGKTAHLLSRLRTNPTLFELLSPTMCQTAFNVCHPLARIFSTGI